MLTPPPTSRVFVNVFLKVDEKPYQPGSEICGSVGFFVPALLASRCNSFSGMHLSLGAGKTTFVNCVLKEQREWKICVLENEFGEVSIDDGLGKSPLRLKNVSFFALWSSDRCHDRRLLLLFLCDLRSPIPELSQVFYALSFIISQLLPLLQDPLWDNISH